MVLGRTLRTAVVALLLSTQGAAAASAAPVPPPSRTESFLREARGHRARVRHDGAWIEFHAVRADSAGVSGVLARPEDGIGEGWAHEADRIRFRWDEVDSVQVPRRTGFPVAATLGFVAGAVAVMATTDDAHAWRDGSRLGQAAFLGLAGVPVGALAGRALTFWRSRWTGVSLR